MPVTFSPVRDIAGLELYQTRDSHASVAPHVHQVFSLSVLKKGRRIHQTRRDSYPIAPYDIVVVNLDETHSHSTLPDSPVSSCSIRISPTLFHKLNTQLVPASFDHVPTTFPVLHDRELACRILSLAPIFQTGTTLAKEETLLDILTCLYQRHTALSFDDSTLKNDDRAITLACEYLQEFPTENIPLQTLSAIAGLSPFHLSRIFTRKLGVPPHVYQLQVRLHHATRLLSLGYSAAQVALESGFCDQSHFQRVFKKKFGITPGQYEQTS